MISRLDQAPLARLCSASVRAMVPDELTANVRILSQPLNLAFPHWQRGPWLLPFKLQITVMSETASLVATPRALYAADYICGPALTCQKPA